MTARTVISGSTTWEILISTAMLASIQASSHKQPKIPARALTAVLILSQAASSVFLLTQ